MKRTILILTILLFGFISAFSQKPSEQVKQFANDKDYEKAAALIPEALKNEYKNVNFLLLCGDIYFELEKYEDALKMYQKADDEDRNEIPIMRKVAKTLSITGRHNESIELYKKALKKDESNVKLQLELGMAYIKADSLSRAELIITRAREMDKKSADANEALGDLYFAQRVYELARENYEEALSKDDKLIQARIKLATSYYWLANKEIDDDLRNELFSRSLKEWNIITKQDPKNAKAYYEQGKILYFGRKFGDAAQAFYQYILLRPSGSVGRWYLAQSLYEIGKCDSAAPHLELVSQELDSVKIKAKLLLARCYFENGNYQKSIEKFGELKKDTKLEVIDMKRYSRSYLNIGDTTSFLREFTETINTYPDELCNDMFGLGKTLIKMKKYTEAIGIFNKKLNTPKCKDSLEAQALYWIGLCYFFTEKDDANKNLVLDTAKQYLEKSIALDTNNLSAYLYLGDVFAAQDDLETSENLFFKVIAKGSADTAHYKREVNQAYQKACSVKLDKKKYPDLVKIGNEWIKIFPDEYIPYLYIAVGYQGQSDKENACKYYKKVLTLDPKNAIAKKNLTALGC
jgi:tetratricopeptide (TPR) repeat protein